MLKRMIVMETFRFRLATVVQTLKYIREEPKPEIEWFWFEDMRKVINREVS